MSVSLSVCLLAYLRNRQSKLDEIFCLLSAAIAPSSCDNNSTRCVFLVLWMTSYLRIIGSTACGIRFGNIST